jgi:acetolactate synthase-1/2/3 large subunit
VVQSAEGRGAVSDHNPVSLGAGMYPGNPVLEYLQAADVVLAVGTRLLRGGVREDQQIIQIDIDGDEIGRNYENTFGLEGDAAATLSALLEGLKASGGPRASRTKQFEEMKAVRDADGLKTQPQGGIVASLRAGAPEDTIHVTGMTQIGYYSRVWWPVYHPRSYLTSGYSGNLGYAYPVGLGAKVACPDKPVLVSSGDGGFLFNSQEIATAVQHKINVVVVVFNDNAYGNVSRDLDMDWGGTYGAELHNPDFVRMAEAYGAMGLRVNEPDKVGDAVADAFQLDRPVLVEVPVGRMPRPSFFPRRPQREQAPARS